MSHTVSDAIDWAIAQLSTSDSPKLDAELLLAFQLEKNRSWLKTWPEKELSQAAFQEFQSLVKRRASGEPVAYILGHQDFWTFNLAVTPDTLIPRPETEHLVECALEHLPVEKAARVVDLGTGTGAIAMAIASERPNAEVWAVDVSEQALAVAEKNRHRYQLENVTCLHSHWLDQWPNKPLDLVVSNPPYIADNDPHLNDLSYEPITALVAEDSGLSDIRIISEQAKSHLKPGGWLMFEHGFEQAEPVQKILRELGYESIETIKDYAGHARVTIGRLTEL
ncbi:peptide chain release factor N(5)-glutamine methyltransferase [Kangiella sediminilitoris]|uniref:Release factor glutamine methyltransferase n=1 Tax=Kangiella sediminilitoris TaxID=1144748 RepID=A0A1B3BCI6_9GAMM|nr:peptide chain release factor N(5)-glutamine methyltransferase [Kangiella sediminilitoris]AOE50519.1 Release factor glutamine methyltransferase [Kangiella sediminilitoris]